MKRWHPFLSGVALILFLGACSPPSAGQVADAQDVQAEKDPVPESTNEAAAGPGPADPTGSADTCPVTTPQNPPFSPPRPYPSKAPYAGQFWYGMDELWTMLNLDGTWRQLPLHEHGYTQKTVWWRQGYDWRAEPEPDLTVTGRRLDAAGAPLFALRATNGYHPDVNSFMLVGVESPEAGCWEITGQIEGNELSFVVLVAP